MIFYKILQVASLKHTITKKDEEIERLQVSKDKRNGHPPLGMEKQRSVRYGSSSPVSKGLNNRSESMRVGRMSLDGYTYGYRPKKGPSSLHGEGQNLLMCIFICWCEYASRV